MEREGISHKEALSIIRKDDEERRKWSEHLYGIDTWDSSNYDLVIHIRKLTVKDAVDMICHAARLKRFQTTPESKKAMDDLVLTAEVRAALMHLNHKIEVSAENGVVLVKAEAPLLQQSALIDKIGKIAKNIPGVKEIKKDVLPITPFSE